MSWPESTKEETLRLLDEIEKRLAMLAPGDWCNEDCIRILKRIHSLVWDALITLKLSKFKD